MVRARNPNQKADLGLADASVFVLPLWVLDACQFASGINKRVSVWVISVHARARARDGIARVLANGTSP